MPCAKNAQLAPREFLRLMTGGVWQVMKDAQPETVLMDTSIPAVRAGPPSPILGVSLSLN